MKNFDKLFLIELEDNLSNFLAKNTLSVNELFDRSVATFADVVNDFLPITKAIVKKKTQTKTMNYKQFVVVY